MELTNFQKRCQDCACLIEKNGKWFCDECFGQPIENIDDCPEGVTLEEVEKINSQKIKVKTGARESEPKKDRKPKTVKVSDEKTEIFNKICEFLAENFEYSVEKQNKLCKIYKNGKEFKLDLVETRQKKK